MTEKRARPDYLIDTRDPRFSVRRALLPDLIRINEEAERAGWSARWSSVEALKRQVKPGSTAFLCPLLHNSGPKEEPESYRCYVWFNDQLEKRGVVSLLDVSWKTFSELDRARSIDQLERVVFVLLANYTLARLL